jgi:hypothetical protein
VTIVLAGFDLMDTATVFFNGSPRAAQFLDRFTIKVAVPDADLARGRTWDVMIGNPPPGGGLSGTQVFSVLNPSPLVSALDPSSAQVGATAVIVTVTGTGFIADSQIWVRGFPRTTTFVDATHLRATIADSEMTAAAVLPVSVFNPSPGGGLSSSASFTVKNPVPVLTSITPASAVAGSGAYVLEASGTTFLSGATLRWNGSDRPTSLVSSTVVRATLLASDVGAAGTASVTVANPAPGGGDSIAQTFTISAPPPRITSSTPAFSAAGGAAFPLTLQGSGFTASSTVTWNGVPRAATFVSAGSLRIDVPAVDVAAVGSAAVVVRDAAGPSLAYGFPILAALPGVTSAKTVALVAKDLSWDPVRGQLYASVGSGGGSYAGSVVRIDPATASVLGSIATGSDPGRLALSDDATKLYVAKVQRIDLPTATAEAPFALGNDFFGSPLVAGDLQALPGRPGSVAVARRMTGTSPPSGGVAVYDDGVQRPLATSSAVFGGYFDTVNFVGPGVLYSYTQTVSSYDLSRIQVLPSGAIFVSKVNPFSGFNVELRFDSGRFYATTGLVAELDGTRAGSFNLPSSSPVRPDWAHGRVFFLSGSTLSAFTPSTFLFQGSIAVTPPAVDGRFELWGTDGVAYRTATQVVLVRSPLIGG